MAEESEYARSAYTPVIINPASGQGRAIPHVDYIQDRLAQAGLNPTIILTSKAGDAKEAAEDAVRNGCDTVIAAGGDGTVNEVINGLKESGLRVGLVPLGTGNVLARDMSIPVNDIEAACDIIVRGVTKSFDLAKADGRYFALMAGFGFDADVVSRVAPRLKNNLGAGAYAVAIMESLLHHKAAHFTLRTDSQSYEFDATLVVVANSGSYAYNIKVAPEARMDDGLLDVCVFVKASPEKVALLRQAWHVMVSGRECDSNIVYLRTKRIVIESVPDVLVQIDGDVCGSSPTVIETVPACLKLIVPG